MDALLASGFADTFRRLHPEARDAYSWWSYRMNARARNVGWRIDYVLAGESLFPRVKEAFLLPEGQADAPDEEVWDYLTAHMGSEKCS